jgi:hypothetical protein
MDTSTQKLVTSLLDLASKSLGCSFARYWPASGNNAPQEKNVSFHLAHTMLREKWAVFAEAVHPDPRIRGVDLVGVSPEDDWFLACESKRLYTTETLTSTFDDLGRLKSFWLNRSLSEASYGGPVHRLAAECRRGYGLVVGLHWAGRRSSLMSFWQQPCRSPKNDGQCQFVARVKEVGGVFLEPTFVYELPKGSRIYLLSVCFQIVPQEQPHTPPSCRENDND